MAPGKGGGGGGQRARKRTTKGEGWGGGAGGPAVRRAEQSQQAAEWEAFRSLQYTGQSDKASL
ncbi:MAG: hypothetical protein FRX49_12103 [Trebouxia sp. A1-2]|nr:MAG: hypothetical protein FRX49_12103 [Trebouxia sp. A1-2]